MKNMLFKYIKKAGMVLLGIGILTVGMSIQDAKKEKDTQQTIADNIIRLHVIANSDTDSDQALKLKVKDNLVKELRGKLEKAKDKKQAEEIIQASLSRLETIANKTMQEEGYPYESVASLEKTYFPAKLYGDMLFPEGDYEALRVKLGEASGKNWWCVMFPTLCFVDSTYNVVPDKSKEKLQEVLPEDDYQALLTDPDTEISVRFKIVEWWKDFWSK